MSGSSATKQYDWSVVPPGVAVLETVAELDDCEIEALPPLLHVVDVDALDDLLRWSATADSDTVDISFRYHGYSVSMSSDGWLTVTRPATPD
ncbi:HalOD1 output domain-containing protein [Halorubrum sp. DTA46]|uniref:HalOD1 output domain-containing protein n=1 Tax=Halorubrum sp. DTA46 TaxID=3402162 RepID=UPI003AAF31DD